MSAAGTRRPSGWGRDRAEGWREAPPGLQVRLLGAVLPAPTLLGDLLHLRYSKPI